jgi:HPt (histidine-containing phosphotransfer) domain-containing protein
MADEKVDWQMIAELRAVMEDEFPMLLETFFSDTEQRLNSIEKALMQGNAEEFGRACHSLKGSASNLGLNRLLEVCRQGEKLGREGGLEGCATLLEAIKAEVSEVTPLLKAEMDG